MSVQFGRWNFDGRDIGERYIHEVQSLIAPFGPDRGGSYHDKCVCMLHQHFFTTDESRQERQPYTTTAGSLITWDGRLDNRRELLRELSEPPKEAVSDLSIVALAYRCWGIGCLAKLTGDWALAIWNPAQRQLILAKDAVGTRQLYYHVDRESVTWSTILDPLVLLADNSFRLEREYLAAWLSDTPASRLTPYVGVQSVEPSSFVAITPERARRAQYWDFDQAKKIRYRCDEDYEEHFRSVFAEAVRRRLRADKPVLAELSGGMDSSSIVCTADLLVREAPRLQTISYFNDSDPNWDEKQYFECVEEQRGQTGYHIDLASVERSHLRFDSESLSFAPNSLLKWSRVDQEFADCFDRTGARVLLSGFAGDEVMGGVPTPIPELADLLVELRIVQLARQLKRWALTKRKPWIHLLADTIRSFLPAPRPNGRQVPSWINLSFARRYRAAIEGYPARLCFCGPRPSFQENIQTIQALRGLVTSSSVSPRPLYESRYPFLDRDLLNFICALPREQLVRPNQRRSLMRRALQGFVPQKILERRRKAFATRNSMLAVAGHWASIVNQRDPIVCSQLGMVNRAALEDSIANMDGSNDIDVRALRRTLAMEYWLRKIIPQPFIADAEAQMLRVCATESTA